MCHPERSAMHVVEGPLAAILIAILLTACGENTTTEKIVEVATGGTEIVSSVKDLPKCTKENAGEQVWVKDESATRICVDGKWFATIAKDTSSADFSCTTKELKDKSGLKIICNGDSIGVVLNGAAGKDGENGAAGKDGKDGTDGKQGEKGDNGVGCSIAAQTDSLVTIKCGDKSMTLNLRTGGASVDTATVDTTSIDTLELDSEKVAISLDSLAGYSQKGPFLKSSTVYLYELSDGRTLKQTNGNFTSEIKDDDGRYKFSSRNLVSQYALLVADGKYRNEVTGEKTTTAIKLQAYTNMLMRRSANVNLLTHLEKDRVYYLVTKEKKTVRAAKKQAQAEILEAFNIDASSMKAESEDLDVFGKTDADASLLAISVLLQGDGDETDLSVLLTEMADDFAEDGTWGDAAKRAEIADWAATVDSTVMDTASKLAKIRKNVKGWGLGGGNVPDFEKFVRRFWSKELGLGICGEGKNKVGTVKNVSNKNSKRYYAKNYADVNSVGDKVRFICDDASLYRWRAATSIEKDTATWGAGDFDGEVRKGQVNTTTYYIYEKSKKAWREATLIEKDTYQKECTKDGAPFSGIVTGWSYVCDADTFRAVTSDEIRHGWGCTSYNRGMLVKKVDESEYGEYGYLCENDGSISPDILIKRDTSKFGVLKDKRDGKSYYTIKIGTQVWMAENLNFDYKVDDKSYGNVCNFDFSEIERFGRVCKDNSEDCSRYGRYYTWAAAMDSAGIYSAGGKGCGTDKTCSPQYPVRGVCPEGWHLPDSSEWQELFESVGKSVGAMKIKGTAYWTDATDAYGFSVLPSTSIVNYVNGEEIRGVGLQFLTSSQRETDILKVCFWCMDCFEGPGVYNTTTTDYNSIRCVKD
jgi:uncharacterized protein (TIGR02145 family)